MEDKTYNGWTNYATWRVNLERIDGLNPHDMGWPMNTYPLAEALRDHVEEQIADTTGEGIGRSYALAFVSYVNWHEIAEHMIDAYADAA